MTIPAGRLDRHLTVVRMPRNRQIEAYKAPLERALHLEAGANQGLPRLSRC